MPKYPEGSGSATLIGCFPATQLQKSALQYLEATIGFADLTASATSQVIAIGELPAGAQVRGVDMRLGTAFSGGSISAMDVDVGSTGDDAALVAAADVSSAAVDGQVSDVPDGIAPHKLFDAATTINATFASTGDDVDAATAGAVTIRVLFDIPG